MSASSPVNDPKTYPAATLEDQDAIDAGELGEGIVMGTPPHSSPDPATDGARMLPLEDGTSAHDAALDAAYARENEQAESEGEDYSSLKVAELREKMEERELDHSGMKKDDMVAALQEDDASRMDESDFISRIEAAKNQDELDAVAELYEAQENEWSAVENAFEAKQTELNDEA